MPYPSSIRIPFCEQVSETLEERIDNWTLIADVQTGARLVEHAWSYSDRGWGRQPTTGIEIRTIAEFSEQIGDSPLRGKLDAAMAAADAARRKTAPGSVCPRRLRST